jgi:predicted transcriptional regulator
VINISPETERRLLEEAERRGQPADVLAESLILAGLRLHVGSGMLADAPEDRLSPEELRETVESVRQGIADADAGRHTPAESVFAETRRRLGL